MADKTSIIKEAQKFLSKGQIDKAIAEWEKLINEYPDGNTFNIIGDLYLKKSDKKSAVESFHKAASFFRQEGFSLKALALYKKVLNISSHDADALNALGELTEEKGLVTDAIKYYLASADVLSKEGKKDRLLTAYEKILSLSPGNIPLRNKVAEIFLREGLISDACKEYACIARTYQEKREVDKAEEYYRKILSIQPSNREAITGMSALYEGAGEAGRAMEYARKATELFPDDMDLRCRYACLSLSGGDREEAKQCLQTIIEREPNHWESRRLLGNIYLDEGSKEKAWAELLPLIDQIILEEEYEEAVAMLETFRDVEPLEAGRRMVSLYRQMGRTEAASAELVFLGDTLRNRGMVEDAVGCYRDALELKPDDEHLKEVIAELTAPPEPEGEKVLETVSAEEKTVGDVLMEADIFLRYGLLNEAVRLLEALKLREPQNVDIHMRLKSLYLELQDKELAVTECLVLKELYRRSGRTQDADAVLHEAFSIYPEDPRLAERGHVPPAGEEAGAAEPAGEKQPSLEDYAEDMAEADFYIGQGLTQEASEILERLRDIFPGNADIAERLRGISHEGTVSGPSGSDEVYIQAADGAGGPARDEMGSQSEDTVSGEEQFEDLLLTNQDFVDAQEMPEPVLDDDVMDIFQEFKRGLEKELGDDDSETHYNLGIAYKEMGLIDDAIKEFQTARGDSNRFIQSSTMLGVCYMEKGLYSLAVEALSGVAATITEKDEAFWPVKYDLAEAYEKNGNPGEALALYTEVYGWNAGFRNVSEKVSDLKARHAPVDGRQQKNQEEEKPKKKDRVSYL